MYSFLPCKMPLGNTSSEDLAAKGVIFVRSPQIMHSANILPPRRPSDRGHSASHPRRPVPPRYRYSPYRTRFLATRRPPCWPFSLAVCRSFRATVALRLAASAPRVASLAPQFVAASAPCAALSACSFRVLSAVVVILVLWLVREASNGLCWGRLKPLSLHGC